MAICNDMCNAVIAATIATSNVSDTDGKQGSPSETRHDPGNAGSSGDVARKAEVTDVCGPICAAGARVVVVVRTSVGH